jgi:hypothetical protein
MTVKYFVSQRWGRSPNPLQVNKTSGRSILYNWTGRKNTHILHDVDACGRRYPLSCMLSTTKNDLLFSIVSFAVWYLRESPETSNSICRMNYWWRPSPCSYPDITVNNIFKYNQLTGQNELLTSRPKICLCSYELPIFTNFVRPGFKAFNLFIFAIIWNYI